MTGKQFQTVRKLLDAEYRKIEKAKEEHFRALRAEELKAFKAKSKAWKKAQALTIQLERLKAEIDKESKGKYYLQLSAYCDLSPKASTYHQEYRKWQEDRTEKLQEIRKRILEAELDTAGVEAKTFYAEISAPFEREALFLLEDLAEDEPMAVVGPNLGGSHSRPPAGEPSVRSHRGGVEGEGAVVRAEKGEGVVYPSYPDQVDLRREEFVRMIILKRYHLPVSKGSKRLESPEGETFQEFFHRFMERKESRTGWRSGGLTQKDVRKPGGHPLRRPFIALHSAMVEAGFSDTEEESALALEELAKIDPVVGIAKRQTTDGKTYTRYWVKREETDDGEF
jgi:hypothetical protein